MDWNHLDDPLHWRKPRRICVGYHGDWALLPQADFDSIIHTMKCAPQHLYFTLTKRTDRLLQKLTGFDPKPHVLLGASASTQAELDSRGPALKQLAAAGWRTWLSLEPLLEEVDVSAYVEGQEEHGIDLSREAGSRVGACVGWTPPVALVLVGGESGKDARPCYIPDIRRIVAQCGASGVPCFVKQLGSDPSGIYVGVRREVLGPVLREVNDPHGSDPEEWPEDLRVRELPEWE
jgi:protein gp37